MKITIETDGNDMQVSSSGTSAPLPPELAERAAALGAQNAGPAPAELLAPSESSPSETAAADALESSMDAGPAPQV
jgi:hypothetical protein